MSTTPSQHPPGQALLRFKRGDTFMLGCQATADNGAPADLTGITVTAQVWSGTTGGALVAALDVVMVNAAEGAYELWAPGDSLAADWPIGHLRADIQYAQPYSGRTLRRSTETFYLWLEADVTAEPAPTPAPAPVGGP